MGYRCMVKHPLPYGKDTSDQWRVSKHRSCCTRSLFTTRSPSALFCRLASSFLRRKDGLPLSFKNICNFRTVRWYDAAEPYCGLELVKWFVDHSLSDRFRRCCQSTETRIMIPTFPLIYIHFHSLLCVEVFKKKEEKFIEWACLCDARRHSDFSSNDNLYLPESVHNLNLSSMSKTRRIKKEKNTKKQS